MTTGRDGRELGWWHIGNLIAGLSHATPAKKYFLFLVLLHTNHKTGKAWVSQKNLAREMNTSTRTVERFFDWARTFGLVEVERVQKGKRPGEQYNRYWLNIRQLIELQRTD